MQSTLRVRHICKIEKLEVKMVIKFFCKIEMSSKEMHEDIIETFGQEFLSYSTVKWAADFLRGRER